MTTFHSLQLRTLTGFHVTHEDGNCLFYTLIWYTVCWAISAGMKRAKGNIVVNRQMQLPDLGNTQEKQIVC